MGIIESIVLGTIITLSGAATLIILAMYAAEAVRKTWGRK